MRPPLLAQYLAQVTGGDVILLDLNDHSHPANPAAPRENNVHLTHTDRALSAEQLPEYISQLTKQYYWTVLWAVPDEIPLTRKAINQADLRAVLGASFAQPAPRLTPNHLYAGDDATAIHQLARRQAGLTLSNRNARGMAHIGEFRVLRGENIPVDLIAGTNAGALYAAGRSVEERAEFARGMNIIIASNVIPTRQERMRWQRGQIAKGASSLVDIMLNEREIMEGEIIRSRMHPDDVVTQPDVARYHVRQYDKAQKIIKPERKWRGSRFSTFANSLCRARANSRTISPAC